MVSPSIARAEAAAGRPPSIEFAGWVRITLRVLGLLLALVTCVPSHYLWKALRQSSPWPRLFLRAAGRVTGARVELSGKPLRRDVIYIANHVSWVDIMAIAGASGSAFVAKDGIRTAPVVGWLASLNRTIYVVREDRAGVAEQIERLREALADTWSVTIFPEGTTTDGRSMLPFKSSLLAVLEPAPAGVMVQPLMLDYGAVGPEIGWLGVERGKNNALRVLARRGNFKVGVQFLEPFDPADFTGRKAIAAESKARITAALGVAMGMPVKPFVGHDAWTAGTATIPVAAENGSAMLSAAL